MEKRIVLMTARMVTSQLATKLNGPDIFAQGLSEIHWYN